MHTQKYFKVNTNRHFVALSLEEAEFVRAVMHSMIPTSSNEGNYFLFVVLVPFLLRCFLYSILSPAHYFHFQSLTYANHTFGRTQRLFLLGLIGAVTNIPRSYAHTRSAGSQEQIIKKSDYRDDRIFVWQHGSRLWTSH